jgi:hypothetical protein
MEQQRHLETGKELLGGMLGGLIGVLDPKDALACQPPPQRRHSQDAMRAVWM